MSMKICTECGKSLVSRKRLVNADKNGMRCRNCNEPDIIPTLDKPQEQEGTIGGTVAKPNYIVKTPPKKRSTKQVQQAVNGEIAKRKHYINTKKKEKNLYPIIGEKQSGKKDSGKSKNKKEL